jgi:hypothetical protein
MNRVEASIKYASECRDVINKYGEDFRRVCSIIEKLDVPVDIHPMLYKIGYLASDIQENFRGEKDDTYYWKIICLTVNQFLINDWEPTCWWSMVMYGLVKDGVVKHTYSVSIMRQNGATRFESGNEQILAVVKELEGSISQEQTDEWFIYELVQRLPSQINEFELQSTQIAEVTTTEGND